MSNFVNLQPTALTPSLTRAPYFDGWDTSHGNFESKCTKCGGLLLVTFDELLQGAWGWRKRFTPEEVSAIELFFHLGIMGKGLSCGRPSINLLKCDRCETKYVFYADFDEYSNSVYRIVAQGLAVVSEVQEP